MKDRIYVCHTFYHVYISCVKELLRKQNDIEASHTAIVLSCMSTDFGDLKARLEVSKLFTEVFEYDEKRESYFPELKKYQVNKNLIINMINRIIFTKKLGKAQIPFLPTDFHDYRDIYVFCDSDPIGYYLNYAKIPYHALEDGLDCLVLFDAARYDNRGHFQLKAWMAARNLIFIQNGHSKYCLTMEVNDISVLKHPTPKYIEQPREEMVAALSADSIEKLLKIFISDIENLNKKFTDKKMESKILILTEPLCDIETRTNLFAKIIDRYGQSNNKTQIIIKPHPMDEVNYQKCFPEAIVLDNKFPMEILNLISGLFFDRIISIFTVPSAIKSAGEVINLGRNFNDNNEDSLTFKEKLNRYIEEILKEW